MGAAPGRAVSSQQFSALKTAQTPRNGPPRLRPVPIARSGHPPRGHLWWRPGPPLHPPAARADNLPLESAGVASKACRRPRIGLRTARCAVAALIVASSCPEQTRLASVPGRIGLHSHLHHPRPPRRGGHAGCRLSVVGCSCCTYWLNGDFQRPSSLNLN